MYHYNKKIEKKIFKRCEEKEIEIRCSAIDELYQEVPNDYFESEKFNTILDIIHEWIKYLPSDIILSQDDWHCFPIFRDSKVHHILHFYPDHIKKNESKLNWQTPGKKSDWNKDWFMFAGSIWKNPKPGRLPDGMSHSFGNCFKCIRYKFLTISYTTIGLYVTIDLKVLNTHRRSDVIKNLGI